MWTSVQGRRSNMKSKTERVLRTANITYAKAQPRTTICRIGFIYNCIFGCVYGVAVRTKTDEENPEIGKTLAYRRAIKALRKVITETDRIKEKNKC